jgi:hypothetical protein
LPLGSVRRQQCKSQEIFAQQIATNDINGSRGAEIRCGNVRDSIKADNRIEF